MLSTLRASSCTMRVSRIVASLPAARRPSVRCVQGSAAFPKVSLGGERAFCSGRRGDEPPQQADKQADKPSETAQQVEKDQATGGPKESSQNDRNAAGGSGGPKDEKRFSSVQKVGLGVGVGAVMLYGYTLADETPASENITVQELMRDYLAKGHIVRIDMVNRTFCRAHVHKDAPMKAGQVLTVPIGTAETFETKLEQLQAELGLDPFDRVPVDYVTETSYSEHLLPHVPTLLMAGAIIFSARTAARAFGAMSGGPGGKKNMFNMGKANVDGKVKSDIKFSDVAGQKQAKREVKEFVDFLKDPSKFHKMGAKTPKGGLLVGPPGTGKTLLAKAVAGEAGVPFYSMSGSDFVEMFVGVGPSRVRDLFAQARENAPSIIFIDEIDAVGKKRGQGAAGGNDERENTLNQFLVEMDGFNSSTGVVVLAGTNRADVLDSALKRPGRFDRQIAVERPDLSEREEIYHVHLKPVNLHPSLAVESVAKRMAALTPGFAGADIANVCNEAAIHAARRDADGVEMVDFERASERVMGGLPKESRLMSTKEKETVSLHECGHAVVGWFLEHTDPLLKVSIVPRTNGALGFAQYLPEDISLYSKEALLDRIAVSLGGRAAEELFVGKVSTGASDDLDKVTQMAYSIVSVYGMNPVLGLVNFSNSGQQFYKPYSEDTAKLIDQETRKIVNEQYERVKNLLSEKKELMFAMSNKLMEKETLVHNELLEILGERPHAVKEELKQFVHAGGNPFTSGMGAEPAPTPAFAAFRDGNAPSAFPSLRELPVRST